MTLKTRFSQFSAKKAAAVTSSPIGTLMFAFPFCG